MINNAESFFKIYITPLMKPLSMLTDQLLVASSKDVSVL